MGTVARIAIPVAVAAAAGAAIYFTGGAATPAVASAISGGLAAGGTAFAATSAVENQNAANKQAKLGQKVAEQNQQVADAQARDAQLRGEDAADAIRRQRKAAQGANLVAAAANGVDISSGSVTDINADIQKLGDLDIATVRQNAAREAYAFQVQGYNSSAQAASYGAQGQSAFGAAAPSLIAGAGNYADRWYSRARYDSQYGSPARGSNGLAGGGV